LGDFQIENVDTGEFLEQRGLALHDRLSGQWSDVAQSQYGRAVSDYPNEVLAAGEIECLNGLAHDGLAGDCHARRVGQ
jgi:hypothetical protein